MSERIIIAAINAIVRIAEFVIMATASDSFYLFLI